MVTPPVLRNPALRRVASAVLASLAFMVAISDTALAVSVLVARPQADHLEVQVDFTNPGYTPYAPSGQVLVSRSIDATSGDVIGLSDGDRFGEEVAGIGDVNGDGVLDIAVGARFLDDGGMDHGGVWVLFMRADGTTIDATLISDSEGGLRTRLDDDDYFGAAIAPLGDIDGDGIDDIAVGASRDDTAGLDAGAIHVLTLNSDGTVKTEKTITQGLNGFAGPLAPGDFFGSDIANIGDVDGDGIDDIAVGATGDDTAAAEAGAVWLLMLNPSGGVKSAQRITTGSAGFPAALAAADGWGVAVTGLGDIDDDGTPDIAMGTPKSGIGGAMSGAVYILRLNNDGTVKGTSTISGIGDGLSLSGDGFALGLAGVGDTNNDGVQDLAIGVAEYDGAGYDRGKVLIVRLTQVGGLIDTITVSDASAGFDSTFQNDEQFGRSISNLGDFDGNGVVDLAVGTWGVDRGGTNRGAAWIVTLAQAPPGDADGDGVYDSVEDRNADHNYTNDDSDGDGTPDYLDIDDDGDGVSTTYENPPAGDSDGDGTPDYLDTDDDGDGIPTDSENPDPDVDGNPVDAWDLDGDGAPDYLDPDPNDGPLADADGDSIQNGDEEASDTDGDGADNWLDPDDDGDGIDTIHEDPGSDLDSDGDGIPNYLDTDDDGDGIDTISEGPDLDGDGNPIDAADLDGDGIPDYLDLIDDRVPTTSTTTTTTPSTTTTTTPTGLPRDETTTTTSTTSTSTTVPTPQTTTTTTRVLRPPTLTAHDDIISTVRDVEVIISILDNDIAEAEIDLGSIELSDVDTGSLTLNADGTVTFTPEAGFTGSVEFEYTLTDLEGNTSTAKVTIQVVPPQLSPEAQMLARVERPESTIIAKDPPSVGVLSILVGLLELTGDLNLPLRLLLSAGAWSGLVMIVFNRVRRRPKIGVVAGVSRGDVIDVVNRRGNRSGYALTSESDLLWVTGRKRVIGGVPHVEIETPAGRGYVPAAFIGDSLELHSLVLSQLTGR
ncbi:MAG: hypothetical protein GY708_14770 [Actinomycetia bacterium]|nr:hypothetical protein [Actinomycetes bacterium]